MTKGLFQILMSALGSMGFAILFDIRGYRLILEAFGGALGWGLYLAARAGGLSVFWSLLIGSAGVALFSEVMARKLRTPVILLLVPMLIPMIPGGDLYYTMYHLISKEYDQFGATARLAASEAAAIAVGILLISYLAGVIFRAKSARTGEGGTFRRVLSWHRNERGK